MSKYFLFFISLVVACLALQARAEVVNKHDIYGKIEPCEAYLNFLDGDFGVDKQDLLPCHELSAFIIKNNKLSIVKYARELTNYSDKQSAIKFMANTSINVLYGDAHHTYLSSQAATMLISIKLTASGDMERVYLYSLILSKIQLGAVIALCAEDSACESLETFNKVSSVLGDNFRYLDQYRDDFLLMCLLRTDAFLVPIRDLLNSKKYNSCIVKIGG